MTAIYVKNVCKSYDKRQILQNISMNVEKGTVYGLVGSSGCGKTTMLSCIAGLEKWEFGELRVLGENQGSRKNKIGCMPQETALHKYLYIHEIVQFYGFIYNMTKTEIKERWQVLSKVLDLTPNLPLIGCLSGGQLRRASLALALVHSPELVLLDEPTTGVDVLLRKNIWHYLYELVQSSGATILMSTHYIEEARFSDTIGIMRKGRLLVEDSPTSILEKFQCDLLEDAVMHLCREDDSKPNLQFCLDNNFDGKVGRQELNLIRKQKVNCNNQFSLFQTCKKTYGFTIVLLISLLRHPVFLCAILLLPASQGFLSLVTIGCKPVGMHLGVVNNELKNWSLECNSNKYSEMACSELNFLSCRFLNHLESQDIVILNAYNSEEKALSQVHLGKIWGYLVFPENFTQNSVDLAIAKHFASSKSIEGSCIHVYLDHSEYVQAFLLGKHLYTSYMDFANQVLASCKISGIFDRLPFHFRKPVYGTYEDDYKVYVITGVVLLSFFGMGITLTGVCHATDRREGTLKRACSAGLESVDIIISNFITQTFVTIAQLIIWNLILYFVFDFVILGSPFLWIIFCILIELMGVGFGLLLGRVCRDETEVLFVIIFLYVFFIFFGCVLFPLEYMPKLCQHFANIIPTFLPTMSVRSLVTRGVGMMHQLIWPGLVVEIGWIVLLLITIVFTFKITGN